MKKVYVMTEVNYGELCWECDAIQDIKIFEDEYKALSFFKEKVLDEVNVEDDFVLDEEDDITDLKVGDIIRFFRSYQENWNEYFEIKLEEVEISE